MSVFFFGVLSCSLHCLSYRASIWLLVGGGAQLNCLGAYVMQTVSSDKYERLRGGHARGKIDQFHIMKSEKILLLSLCVFVCLCVCVWAVAIRCKTQWNNIHFGTVDKSSVHYDIPPLNQAKILLTNFIRLPHADRMENKSSGMIWEYVLYKWTHLECVEREREKQKQNGSIKVVMCAPISLSKRHRMYTAAFSQFGSLRKTNTRKRILRK